MTTATANEPFAGYDKLKDKDVVAALSTHSQVELAEVENYERSHEDRRMVFDKAALDKADLATIKRVRGYERKFRARRGVLDEVTRLHRDRRVPLVSRDMAR